MLWPTNEFTFCPAGSSRSTLTKRGRRRPIVAIQRGCSRMSSQVAAVKRCFGRSPLCQSRSRLPATGKSLVSTTHSNPAASARRMIASVIPRSRKTYACSQSRPGASRAMSSIRLIDTVDIVNGTPAAEAARAISRSPSGQNRPLSAVGPTTTGRAEGAPSSRVDTVRLETSTRVFHRQNRLRNASQLRCRVISSSAPPSR